MTYRVHALTPCPPDKACEVWLYDDGSFMMKQTGPKGGAQYSSVSAEGARELVGHLMSIIHEIDICRGCGREEGECFNDPCDDVIADREDA